MSRGLFNRDFVRNLAHRHQSGAENHDERLWALVNFEIWQRQFFDGEATELGLENHETDLEEVGTVTR